MEKTLHFSVDSALLKELGERLIGRPFVALAELVKNSYDADATWVRLNFDEYQDKIVIGDNGNGMLLTEFQDFWMRVGSIHKRELKRSPLYKRLMTGSKGVGRLAVQFLSSDFRLETTSRRSPNQKLVAEVKWDEAVKAGDLTEATVRYRIDTSTTPFPHGTTVILSKLKQEWPKEQMEGLAAEIWQLRPPSFGTPGTSERDPAATFDIELYSRDKRVVTAFEQQLTAIENVWTARLLGRNEKGTIQLSFQFVDEEPQSVSYEISNCALANGDFELRIFNLKGRKPRGIRVKDAREYLRHFGGVRVYDAGFQLSYFGKPENDWLGIEVDHSHRLEKSKLLPKDLVVPGGLSLLPTMTRILGVVNVNTNREPDLRITITRDRLQENKAYEDLRKVVRWPLDFYAMEERRRELRKLERRKEIKLPKISKLEDVLVKYKQSISQTDYPHIQKDLQGAAKEIESEAEIAARQIGLIAPLASAGISTVAYQHELGQQFVKIEDIIKKLENVRVENNALRSQIKSLAQGLSEWLGRARATNELFSFLATPSNVRVRKRFAARAIIEDVASQVKVLARGIPITLARVDRTLLMPPGSVAEWSSIFQNVFINAFNAMLDSERKVIDISSRSKGKERQILIQNTGIPLDLDVSQELFQPFIRYLEISPERRALGYGGSGLGLTIVRMIANNLGCRVRFVIPERQFNTAFSLVWDETS